MEVRVCASIQRLQLLLVPQWIRQRSERLCQPDGECQHSQSSL